MYLTVDEAANEVWTGMTPIVAIMDAHLGKIYCHHRTKLQVRCTATVRGGQRTKWRFRVRETQDSYVVQARLIAVDGHPVPPGSWKVVS